MAEIYNIRDIKIAITKVLYTPAGNRFRLHNDFVSTSVQDSKFIFVIYSGKQRFIEVGFSDPSVYKMLRFLFRNKTVNNIIINISEFCNVIRSK